MSLLLRLGLACLVVAACLATVQAQTQPAKGDDAKTKRLAYVVKYGSAAELADVLSKHFKGTADLQFVADREINMLLISGPAAATDEALATLAKLDRRPQLVAVEILMLDVTPKKGADGKLVPGDMDAKEFSGPSLKVLAYIKQLQKSGGLEAVRHYSLTALENQATKILQGETKPFVTGTRQLGGKTTSTIMYRDLGTSLVLTPRLEAGGAVLLELKIDDSRMLQSPDAPVLGMDDNGQPIRATEFAMTTVNAKVSVASGQAVLVEGVDTKAKTGGARTLIIVVAKVMP